MHIKFQKYAYSMNDFIVSGNFLAIQIFHSPNSKILGFKLNNLQEKQVYLYSFINDFHVFPSTFQIPKSWKNIRYSQFHDLLMLIKKSSIFQIVTSCYNYRYIQIYEITFSLFHANPKFSTFQITSCHNYRHICFMNDFYVLERLSLYGTMGVWNKILPSKLFHYLDFSVMQNSTNSAT